MPVFRANLFALLLFIAVPCPALILNICIDTAYWYPFTYSENKQAKGIHVDIVKEAAKALDQQVRFVALPWKRCLLENKSGHIGAVVSASYKAERAEFLYFPDDAATNSKSDFRLMQVEYNLVTLEEQDFEFTGDLALIPEPVRIPLGYSIAQEMKEAGLWVDDAALNDQSNIQKLIRDKIGSVIVIPELARHLSELYGDQTHLKISQKPIRSKSYFIAFSKNTLLNEEQRQAFWEEIRRIRNDERLMATFNQRYR